MDQGAQAADALAALEIEAQAAAVSPQSAGESCYVCPYCPKTCIVVYKTRKLLQEHVRSDTGHHPQIVPEDSDLEMVMGVKGLHNSRYKWLRVQLPVEKLQLPLPEFSMAGFRYKSKFEGRLHLLDKYKQYVTGDHPGFEMKKIGKDLQFNADAILFLKRVEAASHQARYKVRQFAKRDPTGSLTLSGFNSLNCEDSVRTYSRTIARFVYFAIASDQKGAEFQVACEKFRQRVDAKEDASSKMRCDAFEDLLIEAVKQPQTEDGFCATNFIDLFYVVAPNGFLNRTADFVRHAAVHIIYAIRGTYILICQRHFCPKEHEDMSLTFLNEQVESAYESVQSRKRVAASCLESLECKVQWTDSGDVEVLTGRGRVSVSMSLLSTIYNGLLKRCHVFLGLLGCPIMSNDMIVRVQDPPSKKPGEGIMSMNEAIFREYVSIHTGGSQIFASRTSIKQKKIYCGQIYSLGKTLAKALYLAGGPSARLTEISAWMVSNSDINYERNVRFIRSSVSIVNTYSKANGPGISQKVVCFADAELTGLVLTYLIVLKHFECLVIKDVPEFEPEAEKNSRVCFLIDKGKPIDGTKLGKIFREEWISQNLDVGVADMRQVLECIARKEGCLLNSWVEPNPLLLMANHSKKSSNSTYGRSFGFDLPGIDCDIMEECWRYSQTWNRKVLGCASSPFTTCASADAGFGVADVVMSAEISGVLSVCPLVSESPASHKRTIQSQSGTQGGLGLLSQTKCLKRACHISGVEGFNLREKQAEMMQFLNSNQDHHSLFILPTGSGKTKVVLLDSISRNVCNVIFVPLNVIELDILKKKAEHIGCIILSWEEIKLDFAAAALRAHVVVASYEHARENMIPFFQQLEKDRRLGYCFIDEAEQLLLNFRHFEHFWALTASCVSLLKIKAMTATLRPRDKVSVERCLGIKFDSELRHSSRRDDVTVSCRFLPNETAVENALLLFVEQVLAIESSRILIFSMWVKEAEHLGALLGKQFPNLVSTCHSKRRENLNRVSVVTSCFASGVNVESLSHLAVMYSTWSVENSVQVCLIRA